MFTQAGSVVFIPESGSAWWSWYRGRGFVWAARCPLPWNGGTRPPPGPGLRETWTGWGGRRIVAGSLQSPRLLQTQPGGPLLLQGVKNWLHLGAESAPKAGSPPVPSALRGEGPLPAPAPRALGLQCGPDPPRSTSCCVNTGGVPAALMGSARFLGCQYLENSRVSSSRTAGHRASPQRWSLGRGGGRGGCGSGALTQEPRVTIRTGTF